MLQLLKDFTDNLDWQAKSELATYSVNSCSLVILICYMLCPIMVDSCTLVSTFDTFNLLHVVYNHGGIDCLFMQPATHICYI